MTQIEKAIMHHLRQQWHAYADVLTHAERDGFSWYMTDLLHALDGGHTYRPDGRRRSLDA